MSDIIKGGFLFLAFSLCITSISLAQSEEEWEKLLENSDAGKKLLEGQQKQEASSSAQDEKRTISGYYIDAHCHLIIPDMSSMSGMGGGTGQGGGMRGGMGPGGMRGSMGGGNTGRGMGGGGIGQGGSDRSSNIQQRNESSFNSIASLLKRLPNDLAQKIAYDNAVELYKLK